MKLIPVDCVDYGRYYLNPANISFVSTGESRPPEGEKPATCQLFFHFIGGKESCMIWVEDPSSVISSLNAG